MSVENMGNGYVKVGVKQEDLEESIAGLRQLKPILQAQVTRGNGNNKQQAAIDRAEIGKHFDTAINAMLILYSAFEASEMTEDEITKQFDAMEREAKKEIDTGADKRAFMYGVSRTAADMRKNNLAYICSPYRGNILEKARNIIYAKHLTKLALQLGHTPITTHLYLTQVLNDNNPTERRQGLKAGGNILNACDTIIIGARYGVSAGMAAEMDAAKEKYTIIVI